MIRNAMFYLNQNKPSVYDTVRVCAELCRARGIEPIFFEDDREELVEKLGEEAENARYLPEPDAQMVDMLFVFGGDGTVLQAARETKKILVPIIGVNLGTVGYMTEIELSGLEESLDRLIRDDFKKERRMMLNGKVCCADGTVSEGWALNDIVISRS